jgi:hypothetical protein
MTERFSHEVLQILEAGEWFDGRRVAVSLPEQYHPSAKAKDVLSEFGGLQIGACGPGVNCARSDIAFDPELADFRFLVHPTKAYLV